MPIKELNGRLAFVKLELVPAEISDLVRRLDYDPPQVPHLEQLGKDLLRDDFPSEAAVTFVREVCLWGRGNRIVGRVVTKNTPTAISDALRAGRDAALAGNSAEGVGHIAKLKFLRQSFASKQLRFLVPERAVILDSVIRERLGYPETVDGYREFLRDCHEILRRVQASDQVDATISAALRVCDIEAAIFAKLQGY